MYKEKMKSICNLLAGVLVSVTLLTGTALASETDPQEEKAIRAEHTELGGAVLPIGNPNDSYVKYFTGQSYLANLSTDKNLPVYNVTFAHGAHTFWHIHHGSCQVLVAESGRGYYQIWGEEPMMLSPGATATILAGVKHWHGAAPKVSFQHVALVEMHEGITTEWLEPVDDKEYQSLK